MTSVDRAALRRRQAREATMLRRRRTLDAIDSRLRHLPGKHDQDKHGGDDVGIDVGGDDDGGSITPLTDAEYEAHTANIEATIGKALKDGKATDAEYGIDVDRGIWQPERARVHKEIATALYARGASVPNEGKTVVAGGLGGAGKSTVLKGHAGVDQSKYLTLNPDDVKEEMASRDLIPEIEGLSPMEAASLVHEESSHITNLVAKMAYADRKNVIWDITMASKGSTERRVKEMRAAGYDEINAVFVDIPVETSVSRALARHRRGMEAYREGEGDGGRYVPPSIIRKNESATTSSKNRETFDALQGDFDNWSLYDNSGKAPVLLSKGKG